MNTVRRQIKAEDGYILLYVMVVVIILCILAASVCTSAVRNLKVQQHSVEHMKFVYEAEGIGERFVSELCKYARFEADGITPKTIEWVKDNTPGNRTDNKHIEVVEKILTDGYLRGEEQVKSALEIAMIHAMNDDLDSRHDTIEILDPFSDTVISPEAVIVGGYDEEHGTVSIDVKFRIVAGDSQLDSLIKITSYVSRMTIPGEGEVIPPKYQYKIGKIEYIYQSYVVGSAVEVAE